VAPTFTRALSVTAAISILASCASPRSAPSLAEPQSRWIGCYRVSWPTGMDYSDTLEIRSGYVPFYGPHGSWPKKVILGSVDSGFLPEARWRLRHDSLVAQFGGIYGGLTLIAVPDSQGFHGSAHLSTDTDYEAHGPFATQRIRCSAARGGAT
jgi:hypothetical protein